ncbi:MAG: hypothetical protein K6F48_04200 [Paludibacteraceae bacterium]|nr:hypothetical protein [Paludibacteraceae bacterium]
MRRNFKFLLLIGIVATVFTACGDSDDDENGNANGGNIIENGAIKAEFSVSADKKVYFSMGNLQYQASTNTWRFAEHQYETIGLDNMKVSSTYDGWIDCFSWGASGWEGGVKCYQPYNVKSTNDEDYYVGDSYSNNLTGPYANADWGVYNKISNGGNEAGQWRTLTKEEWTYLLEKRPNWTKSAWCAKVDGVCGILLLPDNWVTPSGITIHESTNHDKGAYWDNKYTLDEWAIMQSHGAVFLPCSGERTGRPSTYHLSLDIGSYWTSSFCDMGGSYYLKISQGSCTANYSSHRYDGFCVRLVQDVK